MKTPPLSRLFDSPRNARDSAGDGRARRRRHALGLEALEGRVLLSLTPQLVLDINATTQSSNATHLTAVGSLSYFVADDGIHGMELWKSDGTAAGTVLVKDINPGSVGFYPSSLTNVNGTLFFTTVTGTGLWKSDGTAAGTVLVRPSRTPHN
jgi:ELWxxDGT repeat protein